MLKRLSIYVALLALLSLAALPITAQDSDAESGGVLNIYSARHYGAIELPFQAFEEETGIEVRVSQGPPRVLLDRLRAETENGVSPADLLLAIDAGVLSLAAEEGLLQPVESEVLTENIDETQRDPENRWFGLSQRVRTIVYNPETVDPSELSTYAALADPQWENRLCLRPASHIYTVSLVSSLIFHQGEEAAEAIVAGWVANNPVYINSDTRIIQAVGAGQCDVGIVNHYYLGRMRAEDNPDGDAVEIFWANQETTGTFYNINGAGVVSTAANRENAIRFIEWMSTLEGQSGGPEGFPGSNYEFPTNFEAEPAPVLQEFDDFELDLDYPLWEYGSLQVAAVELLERTGYGFSEG